MLYNVVSDLCKNGLICPTNGFEKMHFQVLKIKFFFFFGFFLPSFLNRFHVLMQPFYPKSETSF